MFAVVWLRSALDALADVYVTADLPTQDRIATAVEDLNQRLARDPLDEGESRGDRARITFPDRLAVRFWVDESNQVVRVTAVARFGW